MNEAESLALAAQLQDLLLTVPVFASSHDTAKYAAECDAARPALSKFLAFLLAQRNLATAASSVSLPIINKLFQRAVPSDQWLVRAPVRRACR